MALPLRVKPVNIIKRSWMCSIKDASCVEGEMYRKRLKRSSLRVSSSKTRGENSRAEKTNLPLSVAEKAKRLFLEASIVTTCSASAM